MNGGLRNPLEKVNRFLFFLVPFDDLTTAGFYNDECEVNACLIE